MKSVLLIGLGRFGKHIAMELNKLDHYVMAIDIDEGKVEDVMPFVTSARIGNSTNENFLEELGVRNYDLCIVAIGTDFQSSLETTSLLKELGAPMVISRASRDVQAKFLLCNGADDVVYPEKDMAKWVAVRYGSDYILDYIELDGDYGIFEVVPPEDWIGKVVDHGVIQKKYDINIIAIKQDGRMRPYINYEDSFSEEDILVVLGRYKDLKKCFDL